MTSSTIQLWLDEASLVYSEFSFLSYQTENPTEHFADNILFFNRPPKDDIFEGRMDITLSLRTIYAEKTTDFTYTQNNTTVTGKVSNIKCRGGKVTQTKLMADWLELLSDNNRDDMTLLRYPIEGKYVMKSAHVDIDKIYDIVYSSFDFSNFNPHFLKSEISRICKDQRFWSRAKLKIKGNLPTSCYLPTEKQS